MLATLAEQNLITAGCAGIEVVWTPRRLTIFSNPLKWNSLHAVPIRVFSLLSFSPEKEMIVAILRPSLVNLRHPPSLRTHCAFLLSCHVGCEQRSSVV